MLFAETFESVNVALDVRARHRAGLTHDHVGDRTVGSDPLDGECVAGSGVDGGIEIGENAQWVDAVESGSQ